MSNYNQLSNIKPQVNLRVYFAIVELGIHNNDKICIEVATPGQVLRDYNHLNSSTVEQFSDYSTVCISESLM